ncbi:MAG: hypothetical protein QXU17_04565 [Archaeoglobaceae archaeon]
MEELETEIKKTVRRIFKREKRRLGVEAELDLRIESGWGPPIIGSNVYGQAFPFARPPRVWLEVYPEASKREITMVVREELLHIKYPQLSEEEIQRTLRKGLDPFESK